MNSIIKRFLPLRQNAKNALQFNITPNAGIISTNLNFLGSIVQHTFLKGSMPVPPPGFKPATSQSRVQRPNY